MEACFFSPTSSFGSQRQFASVPKKSAQISTFTHLFPAPNILAFSRKPHFSAYCRKHRAFDRSFGAVRASSSSTQTTSAFPQIPLEHLPLVEQVRQKLEVDHPELPIGSYGRDDMALLYWFLKDRKFEVEAACKKLYKAIKWRHEFKVAGLTYADVAEQAATGKAYLHTCNDVKDRPVVIVDASKHFATAASLEDSQRLCVFLIERAIEGMGKRAGDGERVEQMLGIFDLRGFKAKNADRVFMLFLIDVFFNYYPKRLGEVLFVGAPFIFQPGWQAIKPFLKSYASLVRFCDADVVVAEYFSPGEAPEAFLPEAVSPEAEKDAP